MSGRTMIWTVKELTRQGVLDELAQVFDTEAPAHEALDRIDFPRQRCPAWSDGSLVFWQQVCHKLERGLIANGLEKLFIEAARMYLPGNQVFQQALNKNPKTSPAPWQNSDRR